jgi:hypothetical protein
LTSQLADCQFCNNRKKIFQISSRVNSAFFGVFWGPVEDRYTEIYLKPQTLILGAKYRKYGHFFEPYDQKKSAFLKPEIFEKNSLPHFTE